MYARAADREPERLLRGEYASRVAEGPDEPREHRGQQARARLHLRHAALEHERAHGAVADQEDGRDEHRRRAEAHGEHERHEAVGVVGEVGREAQRHLLGARKRGMGVTARRRAIPELGMRVANGSGNG